MIKILSLLLFIGILGSIKGECPSPNSIPIMYDDEHFTCAKKWYGPGNPESIDACNGCDYGESYTMRDGEDGYGAYNSHYPMGSIMIKAGCTLYMYYDYAYGGQLEKLEGPYNIYDNHWGTPDRGNCAPGPGSYKCRCIQQPVSCTPEDGWEVALYCDNTMGSVSTYCSYCKTIGTSYSSSLSASMSIDQTIEEELSAQFFDLFGSSIGISVTTGYNWEHVSSETQDVAVGISVDAEAPAGMVLTIEQAVGHCDGSSAKTEMFRTSTYSKDGTLVSRKVERLPNDKKDHGAKGC